MISHLSIRHFQSLHDVQLDLAPLSVIVGPSSSGKSALIRALHTITANRRGHAFITTGENIAKLSLTNARATITLTRGKTTGDNRYTITPTDQEALQPFTKLGGDVPPEVSAYLGIEPKDAIQFAGQFDSPYLLSSSPADVARTLGALTNVSVIFEAAREANRQKLSTGSTLKTREADLAATREALERFTDLPAQQAAVQRATEALGRARAAQQALARLQRAREAFTTASLAIRRLQPIAQATIPTDADIVNLSTQLAQLHATTARLQQAARAQVDAQQRITAEDQQLAELDSRYLSTLQAAAQCPTCGQGTEHLAHV